MASADPALAELASIFPTHSRSTLRRILTASQGNLERATLALLDRGGDRALVGQTNSRKRARPNSEGRLQGWLRAPVAVTMQREDKGKGKAEMLELSDSDEDLPAPADIPPSAFTKLRAPPPASLPSQTALPPLTLATPELVFKHTGGLCTLIPDFLPKELAGRLFLKLLRESRGEGEGPACELRRRIGQRNSGC